MMEGCDEKLSFMDFSPVGSIDSEVGPCAIESNQLGIFCLTSLCNMSKTALITHLGCDLEKKNIFFFFF